MEASGGWGEGGGQVECLLNSLSAREDSTVLDIDGGDAYLYPCDPHA